MIAYLLLGATYAFAAAAQPGPFQTFLISRAVSQGWRRTLPAALAPLVSDGPIIVLALLVLTQVPPGFNRRCAAPAGRSFSTWRGVRSGPGGGAERRAPREPAPAGRPCSARRW